MEDGRRDKVKITVLNRAEPREHFHQDIELLYLLEGSMDITVGEHTAHMEAEDIIVINANKKHGMKCTEEVLYAQLMIEYQMVSDVLQSVDVIYWCDSTKDESNRYTELRKALKMMLNHYLATKGNTADFGHIELCYRILNLLSVYFLVQTADKESLDDKDKFDDRIQLINNYIRANYNQAISLKYLADQLYLSQGYLSRFFKKTYGMSFVEYLTNIRLFHAVDELLYSGAPITRVAFDNGFASVAVFNKVFKKAYGETPSAFRRKSKEQGNEDQEILRNPEIERRLENYLVANEEKAEEVTGKDICSDSYSVKDVCELKNCWGRVINIGAASDLLKSEIREHVILLRESLGIGYIRFWNVFSKEMLIDPRQADGDYNFTRLDAILDFLLQQGLKPHIEMGMKPKVIMYNVQKLETEGTREVEFIEQEDWKRVLEAMLRHLALRYGRRELDTWRIELWFNENKWDAKDSFNTYYRLFDILYSTVKKYSEKLEVGGCGLRLDYDEEHRRGFYEGWMQQKCRPDFLSIIYYYYDRGEEKNDIYARRSTDNEFMKHRVMKEKAVLEDVGLQEVPFYITEWNLTASSRNYINDSCFKGAYIIKNILDIYGMVDDMGYFTGSDRVSEFYDSSEFLYGGTGVMNKGGVLKPAGFAFEFLKRLYPYYIGKGDHYLISTDCHDSYGIVCHNQRPLSYNYFFTKEDELEKEHLWKYFEDRDRLDLHLKLTDMPNGSCQIKFYRINEQNGNILGIWRELQYEKELSRNDIRYFRRVCEPKLTMQKTEVQNHELELDLELQANEIVFIRVRMLL